MPIKVFDWRDDDMGSPVAVPSVRARFVRLSPTPEFSVLHSHEESDAYEVFLVLEGDWEVQVDGKVAKMSRGEALFVYPHEKHRIRVVGTKPGVMFMHVTPHKMPTHTYYDEEGNKLARDIHDQEVVHPTWMGLPAIGTEEQVGNRVAAKS